MNYVKLCKVTFYILILCSSGEWTGKHVSNWRIFFTSFKINISSAKKRLISLICLASVELIYPKIFCVHPFDLLAINKVNQRTNAL